MSKCYTLVVLGIRTSVSVSDCFDTATLSVPTLKSSSVPSSIGTTLTSSTGQSEFDDLKPLRVYLLSGNTISIGSSGNSKLSSILGTSIFVEACPHWSLTLKRFPITL